MRQQLVHAIGRVPTIDPQRFGDDLVDLHARVQRRIRVLEHHLKVLPCTPQAGPAMREELLAVQVDLTARRFEQTEHDLGQRGLSATGFTDHAQRRASLQFEGDVLERMELLLAPQPATDIEGLFKIFGNQQCVLARPVMGNGGVFRRCHLAHLFVTPGRRFLVEMTGNTASFAGRGKLGPFFEARRPLSANGAARMKHAARRPVRQVRHESGDRVEFFHPVIELWKAGDKAGGIGMGRTFENLFRGGLFHHATSIHHCDAVGIFRNKTKIMGNEYHGRPGAFSHLGQHVHHLRLNRHIQRRGRFVRDQQVGFVRHGDRDHHALAHPARELVRELGIALFWVGHADKRQQLDHPRLDLILGVIGIVQLHCLSDLLANAQNRVQRRQRVLEDNGHRLAAQLLHLFEGQVGHLATAQADAARHDLEVRTQQAQHGEHRQALARSGFTNDAQHFVLVNFKADVLHQVCHTLWGDRVDGQVFDLQHRHVGILTGRGIFKRHSSVLHATSSSSFSRVKACDRNWKPATRIKSAMLGRIARCGARAR